MSQEFDPLEVLKDVRRAVVLERRRFVLERYLDLRDLGGPDSCNAEISRLWGRELIHFQNTIEAIDRAIDNEENMLPSFYETE